MESLNYSSTQSPTRSFFFLLFTSYFLLLPGCEKNSTPITLSNPQLTLAVEGVAVTEAWLTLKVEDRTEKLRFILLRDDSLILNRPLTTNDTTLYDANLLPAHTYTYRAELQKEGQKIAAAGPLSVTTMDTTSHNITWEVDTLGVYYSLLQDVAIANENKIWAVGRIRSENLERFGAAVWDGNEWILKKLKGPGIPGETIEPRAIWYFSENDIWFGAGSVYHFDGDSTSLSYLRNINTQETVENLWASSPEDIYGVGNEGLVVHYDGNRWKKLVMGTDIKLVDVWGTGPNNVWICGYEQFKGTIVFHFDGTHWVEWFYLSYEDYLQFNPNRISGSIHSICSRSLDFVWAITFWGLYRIEVTNTKSFIRIPSGYGWGGVIYKLRGTEANNLLFCGESSTVWHFNGLYPKAYNELSGYSSLRNLSVTKELICIVGTDYATGRAVVFKGKRQ